jgi:tetratricopeptide (TPR) repeat protein
MKPACKAMGKPRKTEDLFLQGRIHQNMGRLPEALDLYEQVLQRQPRHFEALHLLGVIAFQMRQFTMASDFLVRALQVNSGDAAAHSNFGLVLSELRHFDAALTHYEKAVALKPSYAQAYNNLGAVMLKLGRHEDSILAYDQAIVHKPDYAEAHCNRGISLAELNRCTEANRSFERAIALKPDFVDAHWNMSLNCLRNGEFVRGWAEFEWRWQRAESPLLFNGLKRPLWLGGGSIQGKTILLHGEQGFGDTLQFCRYARDLSALGAHVVLRVQKPLLNLLDGLDGVASLISTEDALPDFDYLLPLMSAPLALGTGLATIPNHKGYIENKPEKVAQWQTKLGARAKPCIGLVWRGNSQHANDNNRSIALSELVKWLPLGPKYVSLQKEMSLGDREVLDLRPDILDFGDSLADFSDTAALCTLMDVVISVDTSVAHLAGALGLPVWLLLPFNPDWRWLLDRCDSPWYPTAKLYRQEKAGVWAVALGLVQADLTEIRHSMSKVPKKEPDN